jgi:T5SS/PEP-CTERM-associated repeat protein/autotransporter-associated beta strand protein
VAFLLFSQGFADQISWQNGTGDFSDSTHWAGGAVPGLADACLFSNNGSFSVSFTGSVTNDKASFTSTDGGEAVFNLSGYSWNLAKGLAFESGGLNSKVSMDNGTLVLDGDGIVLGCFNDAQPSYLTLGANTGSQISKVRLDNALLAFHGGTHAISNEVYLTSQYSTGSKVSSLTVSNATVVFRSHLWCGQGNGSTGLLNLAGGTLMVSNYFSVGDATATSFGIVNITGGDLFTYGPNWLGNAYKATGALNLEAGTFTCRNRFEVGHRAGAKGVLTVSGGKFTANADMVVGNFENGLCDTTGMVTVAGGELEVKSSLTMGLSTNCYGSFRVTGCSTSALQLVSVGNGPFGYGEWYQTNGWVTLAGDLEIGTQARSAGLFTLDGGVFSNKTGNIQAGMRGSGRMVVNGGELFANSALYVGRYAGSRGAFEMTGGAASCSGLSIGEESGASGSYVQSGGVVSNRSGVCNIGNLAGSTGSLSVVNGSLYSEPTVYVGNSGLGTMTVSNGLVRLANGVYVGNNASATGTLALAGGVFTNRSNAFCGSSGVGGMVISGGTNHFTGILTVGNSKEGYLTISGGETYVTGTYLKTALGAGSTARIDMSGGYLNVFGGSGATDGYLDIGAAGKCVLEMTGGQIDAEILRIGPSGGAAPAVSKIIMNGGRLNVFSVSYLADTAVGTGEVHLVNGVLSVKQLRGWHGHLEVTFDGGTLEARQSNTSTFIENNNTSPMVHVLTACGLVIDSAGYDVGTPLALPDAPGEHGKLTKKGEGKFLINGATTFTGPIAIEKGEVELGGSGLVTLQGGVQIDGAGLLDLHYRDLDFTLGAGSTSRVDGAVQLLTERALIVPGTASLSGTGTVERVTLQSGSILAKDKATGTALLRIANLTMAPGATVALTGYTEAEFRAGIPFVNGTTLSLPPASQMTFTLNGVANDYVGLKTVADGTGGYQISAYSFIAGTLIRVL